MAINSELKAYSAVFLHEGRNVYRVTKARRRAGVLEFHATCARTYPGAVWISASETTRFKIEGLTETEQGQNKYVLLSD